MSYDNRGITDAAEYQRRKRQLIASGLLDVNEIPFGHKKVCCWRELGLYRNPYIYGPMPWKMTSRGCRREEVIAAGLFVPRVGLSNYLNLVNTSLDF